MTDNSESARSKAVVDAYYQAGVRGRLTSFASYLHPDFTTIAPNLPDVLDFGRFSYDVLFAEDDKVVARVNFGITGTNATIKISEHWTVQDGKATSIWVAYFEPQALLDKLGIEHHLPR